MKPTHFVIAAVFILALLLAACSPSTAQPASPNPGSSLPPGNPSAGQPQVFSEDTPPPFPTKDQSPPATPEIKGQDPLPGWATYTNSTYDFGFRYPDSYLVADSPHEARLTRPGVELRVQFRGADELIPLSSDLPYEGEIEPGAELEFFEHGVLEVRHLVNGQVLAVEYTSPDGELSGPDVYFAIQLVSLQSDVPLSEELLSETRILLSSFEPWTNN